MERIGEMSTPILVGPIAHAIISTGRQRFGGEDSFELSQLRNTPLLPWVSNYNESNG